MRGRWLIILWGAALGACPDEGAPVQVDVDGRVDADGHVQGDAGTDALEPDVGADGDGEIDAAQRPWYGRAVMYEVFVRSFQDSDGDGIGDLRGLIDRLDYLNDGVPGGDDLEVDGLWLMPIFTSDSYHGYDVVDYRAIDPDYGTGADFDALIAACKARGMHVVLDFVMNHSGQRHPWFLDARAGPTAEKRSWYVWRDDDPGWKQPFGNGRVWHPNGGSFYYGLFWSGMPDLNYREPAVVAEMTAIGRSWLDRGVAGFRLDAARYLVESADGGLFEQPETHAVWKAMRADLGDAAYLVGEVWTSRSAVTTYWGGGAELHQAFDFDLQAAVTKTVTDHAAGPLRSELAAQVAAGTPWAYAATFLSNHDLDRISRRLTDGEQRVAAFLLMMLPGTPYLYYGDELGVKSAPKPGDEAKRGPMAWESAAPHGFTTGTPWLAFAAESDVRNVASALANEGSLARYYQSLIRLRHSQPALYGGSVVVLASPAPQLLALLRHSGDEVVLAVVNLGESETEGATIDVSYVTETLGVAPWAIQGILGSDADERVTDPAAVPIGTRWAPHEGRVWKLSRLPGGGSEMQ